MDGQPGADGRGRRLLDDERGLARPGQFGDLLNGPPLHRGHPRGDADHHPRFGHPARAVHPAYEIGEHLLASVEVGDHTVAQGSGDMDMAGGAAGHAPGLHPHSQQTLVFAVDRYDRRLVEDDPLSAHVDHSVGRSQVHSQLPTEGATKAFARHELVPPHGDGRRRQMLGANRP